MARNPIGILAPQFAQGALSAAAARGQQTAAENARIAAQRAEIAARERIAAQQAFIEMQRVRLGYAEMEARNRLADQQNKLEEKRLSQQERLALDAEKNTTERFLANLEEQKTSRISSEAIAKAQLGLQRGQFDIAAAKERRLYRGLEARKNFIEALNQHGPDSEEAGKAMANYAMYDQGTYDLFVNQKLLYPQSKLGDFDYMDLGSPELSMTLARGDEQLANRIAARDYQLLQEYAASRAGYESLLEMQQRGEMVGFQELQKAELKFAESHGKLNQRLRSANLKQIDKFGRPIKAGTQGGSQGAVGTKVGMGNGYRQGPDGETWVDLNTLGRYRDIGKVKNPYATYGSGMTQEFWDIANKAGRSDFSGFELGERGMFNLLGSFFQGGDLLGAGFLSEGANMSYAPADSTSPMINAQTNAVQKSALKNDLTAPAKPKMIYDVQTGQARIVE